ncbi:MAG: hypothetical protein FWF53_01570 [Candidatus Azobacteroides sp.]|nr:hypothetical protein [Candidatus Azobacteroides sp.]
MPQDTEIKLFEEQKIRSRWDEELEEWYFSVTDVVEILTESANPRDYWFKMKQRVKLEDGIELSTICRQFNTLTNIIHREWTGLTVKQHKDLKNLKTQNLRDHMSEAELIFTALAELSTRQIAESEKAKGFVENAKASKRGGTVAKNARRELEAKTGKSVVTGENFLPPAKERKKLK